MAELASVQETVEKQQNAYQVTGGDKRDVENESLFQKPPGIADHAMEEISNSRQVPSAMQAAAENLPQITIVQDVTDRQTDERVVQQLVAPNASQAERVEALLKHVQTLSQSGFELNDQGQKDSAKELLRRMKAERTDIFYSDPDLVGAWRQAEKGLPIDLAHGKASAMAYAEAAKDSITYILSSSLSDHVVPYSSLFPHKTMDLLGIKCSDLSVVGSMISFVFGDPHELDDRINAQLMLTQMKNPELGRQYRDEAASGNDRASRKFVEYYDKASKNLAQLNETARKELGK